MAINTPVTLPWGVDSNGKQKEHKLIITMGMIDVIENDINIFKMQANALKGDIRFSHASKFIGIVLTLMGQESPDENKSLQEVIYTQMCEGEGEYSDPVLVTTKIFELLGACIPEIKKPQTGTKQKASTKKKSNRTRGKNSTK